jgi:MYXO-CTERM domain-containing protein
MQVCDRGRCVDRCLSELGCFPGLRCTDRGTCVESACETVTCGASERCEAGRCVGACAGITCPAGTLCRAGRCVDGCVGVTCDSDQACVDGVCVPRCECRGCGAGQSCGADGRCRAVACATTTCAEGTTCVEGRCVDACTGARCPTGERCELGRCVTIPVPDGGVARDAPPLADVGFFDLGAADAPPTEPDAGAAIDAATDDGLLIINEPRDGCGCRVGATSPPGAGAVALAGVFAALARRRRQRFGEKRSRSRLP